jgi:ABC-type dipeptide/oligopeptide/nickel transport system permease component
MVVSIFFVYETLPSRSVDILFAKADHLSRQQPAAPNQRALLEQQLGLDKPLSSRFWTFFSGLFHGELGHSILSGQSVTRLLWIQCPLTLALGFLTLLLGLPLGFLGGLFLAYHRNSKLDLFYQGAASLFLCVPSFVLASLLFVLSPPIHPFFICLFLYLFATVPYLACLVRDRFLEEEKKSYYQAALSKGLSRWCVFWKHLSPACLATAFSFLPLGSSLFWGATLVVEPIFRLSGLGLLAFDSLRNQDFTVLLGVSLLVGLTRLFLAFVRDAVTGIQYFSLFSAANNES